MHCLQSSLDLCNRFLKFQNSFLPPVSLHFRFIVMVLVWLETSERKFDAFFLRTGNEYIKNITRPWVPNTEDLMELTSNQLMKLMEGSDVKITSSSVKTKIAKAIVEDWGNICSRKQQQLMEVCETRDEARKSSSLGGYGGSKDDKEKRDQDGGDDDEGDDRLPLFDPFDIPESEDGGMNVHVILPNRDLITVRCAMTDTIGVVKALLQPKTNIHRLHQRLFIDGDELADDQKLNEIVNDIEMTLQMRTTIGGGGKRAKSSTVEIGGANNMVSGLDKNEAGKKLQDVIGMTLMRCNANQGASPCITAVAQKLWTVENQINADTFNMEFALNNLSIKQLVKMRDVKGHSTKVAERCKYVSDILFSDDMDNLKDMMTQSDMVRQAMVLCIQHSIIHQFADEGGSISWDDFTRLIQRVEHRKVEESANRAHHAPTNGIGA